MKIKKTIPQPTDQDFVNITWQIVYSGRSHFKLKLSEAFAGFVEYNMTETKEVQQEIQRTSEIIRQCISLSFVAFVLIWLIEGLVGNQVRKGSHPRRTFFTSILG